MASYSGMSEYDIQLRENYKKQQAAAITASRDYKKNNYLSAMEQQTTTQPSVTTTPKTNTNTQTLGGTSSTGGSSSSGGYTGGGNTGGGYIAGSGTTKNSGSSGGGRTGPSSSGYTPSAGTSKRNTGSTGSSSGSTTNSNEPTYTWVHQDKMSPEDYQMRQEYYEQKDAYNQVNQLPYANKLSDEDKKIRADFFLEVKPQDFSLVDPSASPQEQYPQIQGSLEDGEQALRTRQEEVERLRYIYETDPTPENKARFEQHWAQLGYELSTFNDLITQYNAFQTVPNDPQIPDRPWYDTALDMGNHASGVFTTGLTGFADGIANTIAAPSP